MPVSISSIRKAAVRRTSFASLDSLQEATLHGAKTVFLCHSHKDRALVEGVITLLRESGWRVYVDWSDSSMPENTNKETADKIKKKIAELNYFIFLATENSVNSRWCPWEIGYADCKKGYENILIMPVSDDHGRWVGSEYLQLYKKLDEADGGSLAVWEPGQTRGKWLRDI